MHRQDMPDTSFTFSLPEKLEAALAAEVEAWRAADKIARIWRKDASVWTSDGEENWLGWLDIVEGERGELAKYLELREDVEASEFDHILLMGMGGSSLCPEVLAKTFDKRSFHILDSTVPAQVKSVEDKLDLERTLFIVASKSGSTLEPNCFKQYFFARAAERVGPENAGKQFIAITDPGSKMEQIAKADRFRQIVYGDPTVGGRFSALSPFGLTAAAAMGLDVDRLLRCAAEIAEHSRNAEPKENYPALLGLILGVCHRDGRDKLTIFADKEIASLGAWLEQLVAESTGKNGVSIIPVDQEPLQPAVGYACDRVFVYLKMSGTEATVDLGSLFAAGHPVLQIEFDDLYDLGREFFRWEFATAVAGAVMGINPFDQPDVESAKIEARKITDEYERTGVLPGEEPFFAEDGISLFTTKEYAGRLTNMVDEPTLAEILSAHFANVEEDDYFAVLGYVEMNDQNEAYLQRIRTHVLELRLAATCLGFGPRFLHSTGQAYKGGANNGVFLQITADDESDLPVPGQKYTFGVVKAAQARGDFQVLLDRDRRALRVHLSGPVEAGLDKLVRSLIVPVAI